MGAKQESRNEMHRRSVWEPAQARRSSGGVERATADEGAAQASGGGGGCAFWETGLIEVFVFFCGACVTPERFPCKYHGTFLLCVPLTTAFERENGWQETGVEARRRAMLTAACV